MRFLIAPSGFKECLPAGAVADAITTGIRRLMPDAVATTVPLIDGGEGSARQMAETTGGVLIPVDVTGPVGRPVLSHFAMLGGSRPRTAFVEMAAAAGLSLVPVDQRDPTRTVSHGVGELITAALDAGAERVVIGCGDSGICDGGAGALSALGARVLDRSGRELDTRASALVHAHRIDTTTLDPRLADTDLVVSVNPTNVLCGPHGVAPTYGPQKGATPRQIHDLTAAMQAWAVVLENHSGTDLARAPGSGASGGLGAGLAGGLGARLVSRFDALLDTTRLDRHLAEADLVVTAEGTLDASTARGKIPAEVARRAKRHGKPVVALAGTIGPGADGSYDSGIDAFTGIMPGPGDLADAIAHAPDLIAAATTRTLRMLLVGRTLVA